jgi:hypothetical protein
MENMSEKILLNVEQRAKVMFLYDEIRSVTLMQRRIKNDFKVLGRRVERLF